jgi:hypothetical protein
MSEEEKLRRRQRVLLDDLVDGKEVRKEKKESRV